MDTFSEKTGKTSSMRVMCFVSLLAAITCGLLVTLGKGTADGTLITCMFLVGAFAPKAVQKFAEQQLTVNK